MTLAKFARITGVSLSALCALQGLAAAQTYGYSDGQAERALGAVTGGTTAWFQAFDSGDHAVSVDRIVEIASANGSSLSAGASPGSTGGVAVYQDPNGDSDPTDLSGSDLRGSGSWTVADDGGGQLERTLVCANATVTGQFWVAAWLDHGVTKTPAPIDTSVDSNGRSWITGSVLSFDPNDPNAIGNVPFVELSTLGPLFDGVFVMTANHEPTRLHVDAQAMGADDGSSWSDAFPLLQDALCAAHDGDEVWVADGTYLPDRGLGQSIGDVTQGFELESGVAVYGGFQGGEATLGQRDFEANESILSGDLGGDDGAGFSNYGENCCRVVRANGVDASAILDGFVVQSGYSVLQPGCGDRAAGMGVGGGAPTVRNVLFRDNYANVSPALSIHASDAVVSDCTFEGNWAHYTGGAVICTGAGSPRIQDSYFLGNTANTQWAGAILIEQSGSLTVLNCVFSGNACALGGGAIGLRKAPASLTLINSSMSANVANAAGGGIWLESGTSAQLRNSILYGNSDPGGFDESGQVHSSGSLTVDHCDVQGWTGSLGGSGNFDSVPLFVDADGADDLAGTLDDDLSLQTASDCIDAGKAYWLPAGTTTDIVENKRVRNCNVDLGAYEIYVHQAICVEQVERTANRPATGHQ